MAKLEDLRAGSFINDLAPSGAAKIVHVERYGDQAIKATYEDSTGAVRNRLVFRNEEPVLEVVAAGPAWSFDGDGALLRLVSEAYRIQLAHLFAPYVAIHTSRIEPLPHQITAVYGEMLRRQPLRFLLADDPGAGNGFARQPAPMDATKIAQMKDAQGQTCANERPGGSRRQRKSELGAA